MMHDHDHDLSDATLDGPANSPKPAPADPTPRGFPGLPCLRCGEAGNVSVQLEDMSFYCGECDNAFSVKMAAGVMGRWAAVLRWVELAPARPD